MSDPIATAPPSGVWARPMMERDLAALERLREIVMAAAEVLGRQIARAEAREIEAAAAEAEAPGDAEPPPAETAPDPAPAFTGDLSLALNRVARAVRMTCALRARLIDELERLEELQGRRGDSRRSQARAARKEQVGRLLTRIIDDEIFGPEDGPDGDADNDAPEAESAEGAERYERETERYERLIEEAGERLADPDRYGDVLARPVSDFIALVCRDLGLSPDWPRLAREAWAQAEIASGKIGAPLTSFSSPARGEREAKARSSQGGPRSGGGGANAPSPRSAPSVTARKRRATFPARGEGEAASPPDPLAEASAKAEAPASTEASAPPGEEPYRGLPGEHPPPGRHPPSVLSPDWGFNHGRR